MAEVGKMRTHREKLSYDSGCYDLATAFLRDNGLDISKFRDELAQKIQDMIEDFIETAKQTGST